MDFDESSFREEVSDSQNLLENATDHEEEMEEEEEQLEKVTVCGLSHQRYLQENEDDEESEEGDSDDEEDLEEKDDEVSKSAEHRSLQI